MIRIISTIALGILILYLWWGLFFNGRALSSQEFTIGLDCQGGPILAGATPASDIDLQQFRAILTQFQKHRPSPTALEKERYTLCNRPIDTNYRKSELVRNRAQFYMIQNRLDTLPEKELDALFWKARSHNIESHLPDAIGFLFLQLAVIWYFLWKDMIRQTEEQKKSSWTFGILTFAAFLFSYITLIVYYLPWPDNPFFPILVSGVFAILLVALMKAWGSEFIKFSSLML